MVECVLSVNTFQIHLLPHRWQDCLLFLKTFYFSWHVNLKYVSGVHHDVLAMLSFMECGIKLLNIYIATYFFRPLHWRKWRPRKAAYAAWGHPYVRMGTDPSLSSFQVCNKWVAAAVRVCTSMVCKRSFGLVLLSNRNVVSVITTPVSLW